MKQRTVNGSSKYYNLDLYVTTDLGGNMKRSTKFIKDNDTIVAFIEKMKLRTNARIKKLM